MSLKLWIEPTKMYCTCLPEEMKMLEGIGSGVEWDGRKKKLKLPFNRSSLKFIKEKFPNLELVSGIEHIYRMKLSIKNLSEAVPFMEQATEFDLKEIKKRKFPEDRKPFVHQIEGLLYLENFDGAALYADCGTGKSAMSLWDVESKVEQKKIKPSSTLIVGKLMTLETGWESDTYEFTGLKALNLWEPSKSKTVYKEQVLIEDHGEKPEGKGKSKSKVVIYKKKEDVQIIIRSSKDFNPIRHRRMKLKWKEVDVDGKAVKYGPEYVQEFETINLRTASIKKKIATTDHNIHIINHESLVLFEKELAERNYEVIIFDESTAIKNHRSKCFQSLIVVAAKSKYRRVLSGTPSPQGPQDLWSQFFFLDWGITFGTSHTQFLAKNFRIFEMTNEKGKFAGRIVNTLSPGQNGHEGTFNYVESRLKNRIFRCKLRDCTDLPPLVESIRTIYLDDTQRKHYDDMEEQMLVELDDGSSIDVTVNIAKVAKLRQITGGFILNKEKQVKEVSKRNTKLKEMLSLIEEMGPDEKVVIFAEYRAEIAMILENLGDAAVAIYGGVTDLKKIEAQKRFQNDPTIRFIVCQPQSAAYGVNGFNKASRYLIFYSLSYQADTIYQAIKRIERTGQKRSMVVYYLIAHNTIDEVIYDSTKKKEATQQKTINVEILKKIKDRRLKYGSRDDQTCKTMA